MPDVTTFTDVAGTPRTPAQLLALIERIDLAIYNLLSDPTKAAFRYRLGDREGDRGGYLLWLLDARRTYQAELAAQPLWQATPCVVVTD